MSTFNDENSPGVEGGSVEKVSLFLDLVGASALTLGAYVVWEPLALFTIGGLSLVASWQLSRSKP